MVLMKLIPLCNFLDIFKGEMLPVRVSHLCQLPIKVGGIIADSLKKLIISLRASHDLYRH